MRIGQDVSIQVCRCEGYMVMDYPVHAFKKNPTTTDCRFTKSLPDYARIVGVGEKIIHLDVCLCWDELIEMYKVDQEGIDSFVGDTYTHIVTPKPFDLLNLAADIDAYSGLY